MMFYVIGFACAALGAALFVRSAFFGKYLLRTGFFVSLAAGAAGIAVCIASCVMFRLSPDASSVWASDAFSSYFAMTVPLSSLVLILLCSAALIGHKMRTVRRVIALLYPVACLMFTALFASMCASGDSSVHKYVYALGAGQAFAQLGTFAAETVRSFTADKNSDK